VRAPGLVPGPKVARRADILPVSPLEDRLAHALRRRHDVEVRMARQAAAALVEDRRTVELADELLRLGADARQLRIPARRHGRDARDVLARDDEEMAVTQGIAVGKNAEVLRLGEGLGLPLVARAERAGDLFPHETLRGEPLRVNDGCRRRAGFPL